MLAETSKDIKTLREGLAMIQKEIPVVEKLQQLENDSFLARIKAFAKSCNDELAVIQSVTEKLQKKLKELSANFDEPEQEMLDRPHNFFKMVLQLLKEIKIEMDELENQKRLAEMEAKKKKPIVSKNTEENSGVVDTIMKNVKNGSQVLKIREQRKLAQDTAKEAAAKVILKKT